MTTKQQIIHAIEDLPDEASIEDAVERLHLLLKVERGLAQADAGHMVTHEEARKRMARWLP
jgi:predicted transcriptional regulator